MSSHESSSVRKRTNSDPSPASNMRRRTNSDTPAPWAPASRLGGSGGTAAGNTSSPAKGLGSMTLDVARTSPGFAPQSRAIDVTSPKNKKQKHRQQIIGDEKLDEAQGNLDEDIDMKDWELIGPPGTYADGVFKGFQRSNQTEVAVKVVSLKNPHIHRSQWVREQLEAKKAKKGVELSEAEKLKVYEEKVYLEMYNTQTLSCKFVCTFVGYFKDSTTYADKVLKNKGHRVHQFFANDEEEGLNRPYGDHSFFFVLENLPGGDLYEYNASNNFGCGFLLAFEPTLHATEELVHDSLAHFFHSLERCTPSVDTTAAAPASDSLECKAHKEFMYLDTPFLHALKPAKGDNTRILVLKFNTNFKRELKKYHSDNRALEKMRLLCRDVLEHLVKERLICNTNVSCLKEPLPLFFDETFIRTTLNHIMIALNHAHGTPIFHNDLKPDNIMFLERVHAHSTLESKICAKVIDWGCGGFSKDSENESRHEYKPKQQNGEYEPIGKECDIFCVGNTMRFLFDGNWHKGRAVHEILPSKFAAPKLKCDWNTSADFREIDTCFCVPWNPNKDQNFKELIAKMVHPDPAQRISVKDVMQHRWMTKYKGKGAKAATDLLSLSDTAGNPHVKKLNDVLYDFAPPHLKKLHDESHDDGQNEETQFLDLLKGDTLPGLRRSLDVLVMVPILLKAPYAQGFIASNLVALLSKFVADYMYVEDYPHRHLPRTMVLLSHLASHQNTHFLNRIFIQKHLERKHQDHDHDGRTLLDLIAYGVFDCHDPDPNHLACSLYTMLMLLAMSSPVDDFDQHSYKTKDVVRFLRDKHTMHPKPLTSIFEKLVQLLEHLTHSPADAQAQRRDSLTKMLSESSSPLRILHNVLAEAQKNPSHAADMLSETQDHFNSFKRGLQKLQHALVPAVKDPTFSRFIDKFLALPDPGSQLLKIHKLLNYRDFTEQDEMEPMLKSNNGIITSSTHGILSRLVQALLNLSLTTSGADKGSDILVEGGEHSFFHRIMRCMQVVHHLYPKAFQANDAQVLAEKCDTGSSLLMFLIKLWELSKNRGVARHHHLDRDFLTFMETKAQEAHSRSAAAL